MHVSIIIPTYNVEEYIEECINSAFAQTYQSIEVVCIDNNSTDDTWKRLEELKVKYPNLILDKESKPGAPSARNKGLSLARGEWIQFLDSDDLLLPSKIEHQVGYISNDISFIVGDFKYQYLNGDVKEIKLSENNIWVDLVHVRLGNTCSNLYSRKYLVKIGYWNEVLTSSQEYDLMFRLLKLNDKSNSTLVIIPSRI